MTSNRLEVAQTNLESTGKENEVLDHKKGGNDNRPEPRNYFHYESVTKMARNRLRAVSLLLENPWVRTQRKTQHKRAVLSVRA